MRASAEVTWGAVRETHQRAEGRLNAEGGQEPDGEKQGVEKGPPGHLPGDRKTVMVNRLLTKSRNRIVRMTVTPPSISTRAWRHTLLPLFI